MAETIYQIFKRNPQEALEETFIRSIEYRVLHGELAAHMWQGYRNVLGDTGYGSYKVITKSSLENRKYNIHCGDYKVGIHYTDIFYDEITRKCVNIDEAIIILENMIINLPTSKLLELYYISSLSQIYRRRIKELQDLKKVTSS